MLINTDIRNLYKLNTAEVIDLVGCINFESADIGLSNFFSKLWDAIKGIFWASAKDQAKSILENHTKDVARALKERLSNGEASLLALNETGDDNQFLAGKVNNFSDFIINYLICRYSVINKTHQYPISSKEWNKIKDLNRDAILDKFLIELEI